MTSKTRHQSCGDGLPRRFHLPTGDAGVVHEQIDRPQLALDLRDQRFSVSRRRDVGNDGLPADLRGDLLDLLTCPRRDRDLHPGTSELTRDPRAHAASPPVTKATPLSSSANDSRDLLEGFGVLERREVAGILAERPSPGPPCA